MGVHSGYATAFNNPTKLIGKLRTDWKTQLGAWKNNFFCVNGIFDRNGDSAQCVLDRVNKPCDCRVILERTRFC